MAIKNHPEPHYADPDVGLETVEQLYREQKVQTHRDLKDDRCPNATNEGA